MTEIDPATLGDADLLARIRDGDPAAAGELRRRHLHGLTTVAAGYIREHRRRGGATTPDDPEPVVDAVLAQAASLPADTADGEVLLRLCARVRAELNGDGGVGGPPSGLVDLITPSAVTDDVAAAYGSLDERDRVLLWFVAAEGTLPDRLAATLSIGGSDLAATMIHRARSALRRAWLTRRDEPDDTDPACAALRPRLVEIAEEPSPGAVPHLRACGRCREILAELHALPNQLTMLVATIVADPGVPATPAEAPPTTRADGPLVISTTPRLEHTRAVEAAATMATVPVEPAGTDDTADAGSRRRVALWALVAVCTAAAIGVVVWAVAGGSPEAPSDAGVPAEVPPTRSTTTVASSSTSSSTTTSSTTSTSTTVAPPTTVPATAPATPAPTPAPEPTAPAWVPPPPPDTAAPTNPPTTPATTPAPTAAPTTPAPTTDVDPGGTGP